MSLASLYRRHHRRHRALGRRLTVERLELRKLLSAVPFGALPQDTGEFMLGTVTVGVVLLESNGQIDTSSEDWTPQSIEEAKAKVRTGIEWWEQTLVEQTTVHSLDFLFDFTYADSPVPTRYEPIARISDDYKLWVNEFLDFTGYNSTSGIDDDIRQYNHSMRVAHDTNWAFTVFVVNSQNDLDGQFLPGGSFSQAFAFAGGRYIVAPSRRPAMTFTHETGHMFWARDEYLGGASYTDHRGYYDTQNWNAADNTTPGFVQQDSIMAAGTRMVNAYENHTSAPSTLAQLGWQDTDGDGVFDVLDLPHTLNGIGYFDPAVGKYRFRGTASVDTLMNKNSSGPQSDITINTITRAEFRIDGGIWQTAANYGTSTATLDLLINVPAGDHEISLRTVTIDPGTQQLVTSSPLFVGRTDSGDLTTSQGIAGRVWNDVDADGEWDAKDVGLVARTVRIVDANGDLVISQTTVEPDLFTDQDRLNDAVAGATISAYGYNTASDSVRSRVTDGAPTGTRAFAFESFGFGSPLGFSREASELRIAFATPQTYVALDAFGTGDTYGRLEAYDAGGNRVDRVTTVALATGQVATMAIAHATADIASIRAFGHGGSSVQLDTLRFGPSAQTLTTHGGGYWFESLPGGPYRVQVQVPSGAVATSPVNATRDVTLLSGGVVTQVDFGIKPARPWQNQNQIHDVNGDGGVTTSDLILLVSDIARNQSRSLPAPTDQVGPHPYWDVTGDGNATTQDIVRLLTYLSQSQGSGSGESGGSSPPSGGGSRSSGGQRGAGGEGEGILAVGVRSNAPRKVLPNKPASAGLLGSKQVRRRRDFLDRDRIFEEWTSDPCSSGANRP